VHLRDDAYTRRRRAEGANKESKRRRVLGSLLRGIIMYLSVRGSRSKVKPETTVHLTTPLFLTLTHPIMTKRFRFSKQHRGAMVGYIAKNKVDFYSHNMTKGKSYDASFKVMLEALKDTFQEDDWSSITAPGLQERWDRLVGQYKKSLKPPTGEGARNKTIDEVIAEGSDGDEEDSSPAPGKKVEFSDELFAIFDKAPDFHPPSTRNAGAKALAEERKAMAAAQAKAREKRALARE